MSVKGKRTIFVGQVDSAKHKPRHREGTSSGLTQPGTLLQETVSGFVNDPGDFDQFGFQFIVADKDQMRSKSVDEKWRGIEDDVNIVAILPRSGELINALVGQNITLIKGDSLVRNGLGALQLMAVSQDRQNVVAFSDENVTTPPGDFTLVRIRVA